MATLNFIYFSKLKGVLFVKNKDETSLFCDMFYLVWRNIKLTNPLYPRSKGLAV